MKNECKKCGATWETRDGAADKIDKCPFCGNSLTKDMSTEYVSIGDYLRYLVSEKGVDVLRNGDRINALLADYFPKSENEKERDCIRTAYKHGIGKVFCEISAVDFGDVAEYVEKFKSRLSKEAWLSKEAIEYVCGVFFYAIGMEYAEDTENIETTETTENISRSPSDAEKRKKTADMIYKEAQALYEIDAEKAATMYEEAAELGDSDAMRCLGQMYRTGHGVDKDCEKAMEWYSKSAKLGNVKAMRSLGDMYKYGRGVDRDYEKAMEWYKESVKHGNTVAMYNLGDMYRDGEGVGQDYKKAVEWYKKSAKLGNAMAMDRLADMYRDGHGVARNKGIALALYEKAAQESYVFGAGEKAQKLRIAGVVVGDIPW